MKTKHRSTHARGKRKSKSAKPVQAALYTIALIILAALAITAYYFAFHGSATSPAGNSLQIYGTTYIITPKGCSNVTQTPNSNITVICTAMLNVSSYANPSVPYYMIINKYSFLNDSDAYSFLQALRSDLNTSPWYSNIPNAYYNSSVVYTTIVYPDYKNTNTSAEVLAAYIQDNNIVLSASTSNMTNTVSPVVMKKYAEYLLFNYKNRIEALK